MLRAGSYFLGISIPTHTGFILYATPWAINPDWAIADTEFMSIPSFLVTLIWATAALRSE